MVYRGLHGFTFDLGGLKGFVLGLEGLDGVDAF